MPDDRTITPPFTDHYAAIARAGAGGDLPWLHRLRERGFERYRALGLPTRRVEDWRYTNLKPLTKIDFQPATDAPTPTALPDPGALAQDAYRLVVVNGRFRPELSALDGLPQGVEAGGLAHALDRDPAAIEARLGRLAAPDGMAMLALNTALMADGFVLRLPRGAVMDRPLHVQFVTAPGERPLACHPRNLIIAEPGSRATVFESHVGAGGDVPSLGNLVTEVTVGEGARLAHYKLHDEAPPAFHLAMTQVTLDSRSAYDSFVLSVGGRLARHELRVRLNGEDIDCRLNGAYVIAGDQHVDNTTFIDHAAPGSRSRQVYKGVLDETARGVFQGKILVRRHAQQTDGHQLNRALLLSPGAEVDTKPELEIYADDVKCSHGAAIGEIEEDQLFYLRARGIDRDRARDILVEAFVGEVIDEIGSDGGRQAFREVVAGWLAARRQTRSQATGRRP
ncbi:MAG: Fe-S cluster assembly protein SufD [Kiloniellales bacterium]